MTWWNRPQPVEEPIPAVKELHQIQQEMQGDITYLYDQLKRINDRLKQRASRAARDSDIGPTDDPARNLNGDGGDNPRPAHMGEPESSSSLAASDQSQALLTKEQVRELYRRRH